MASSFPCIGYVYRLYSDMDDEIYVGSTTTPLMTRFWTHLAKVNGDCNYRVYDHFRTLGAQHMFIEALEEIDAISEEHLRMHEDKWYTRLQPSLNMNRPVKDVDYEQMRQQRDAEAIKACKAKYYLEHKQEINQKNKARMEAWKAADPQAYKEYYTAYYQANKESQLAQQKETYAANKDAILARNKAYRDANKDTINAARRAKAAATKDARAAATAERKAAVELSDEQKRKKADYEANKEKRLAGAKANYEANRDAINAARRAKRAAAKQAA